MELNNVIVGTRLNEIQKKSNDVKLVFENTISKKIYVLTFEGLLFETATPALNKRVKSIQLHSTLGFRATSQLRHLNKNPQNYRQLYIQMEGSDENNKLELLGALKNYKMSPRRQVLSHNNVASERIGGKKVSVKRHTTMGEKSISNSGVGS